LHLPSVDSATRSSDSSTVPAIVSIATDGLPHELECVRFRTDPRVRNGYKEDIGRVDGVLRIFAVPQSAV
jgi:hypothetical protein